jgi:hypothetical protein
MDSEKKNLKKSLAKFKEAIPSRAKLSMEALFGVTPEIRSAAQHLLDILPREERSQDEQIQWMTDVWQAAKLPCDEDLAKSPIGKATLEMLKNSKPMGGEIQATPEGTVAPEPVPAIPAEPEVDDTNDYLKKLNWPPKPTTKPDPIDDTPHKWQAAKPSPPDKSLRPLAPSDWNSDSSNNPIY